MKKAFSLVELSIILVILGLLTGGMLVGRSLVRASELRSVSTDLMRYQTAIYSFRDKYFALPGDMTNAQSFWGVRTAGSNLVCQQTINVTTGTCNSDGNGRTDYISGDTGYNERFLVWQHLALAGMVEGTFTGASAAPTVMAVSIGTNTPVSKIRNAEWVPYYLTGPYTGHGNLFDGPYGFNGIYLGPILSPLLDPQDQWNIDSKLDDGKPGTGRIFATKASGTWAPGCTTGDTVAADYAVSSSSPLCTLWSKW